MIIIIINSVLINFVLPSNQPAKLSALHNTLKKKLKSFLQRAGYSVLESAQGRTVLTVINNTANVTKDIKKGYKSAAGTGSGEMFIIVFKAAGSHLTRKIRLAGLEGIEVWDAQYLFVDQAFTHILDIGHKNETFEELRNFLLK